MTILFDLNVFIDHMNELSNDSSVDFSFDHVHLIGHSRSGPIVLRTAIDKPVISSVITWASVHSMSYMWERNGFDLQNWIDTGDHLILNGRS